MYDSSDLQLAIALQQQEFEQQQQQQQQPPAPRVLPQSPTTSRSGLVVGPQVCYQFSGFLISTHLMIFVMDNCPYENVSDAKYIDINKINN